MNIEFTSLREKRANLSAFRICVCFVYSVSSHGEERAGLGVFRTFVQFALAWFCLHPLLGKAAVCDFGSPWTFLLPFFVIVALP